MTKPVRSWMQGVELSVLETLKPDLKLFLDATLVYPFVVGSGREDAPALSPIKLVIAVTFVILCRTPSYASSRRCLYFPV
jgi:hypothetical protein